MIPDNLSILGLDQTGAVNARNEPKALSAALLCRNRGNWELRTGLRLPSLRRQCVEALVEFEGEVLILVDSVLGLPGSLNVSFSSLLQRAKHFEHGGKPFGRRTASRFFASFLDEALAIRLLSGSLPRTQLPSRLAETLAGANTVFLEHPFQRNIGCGTFRVLKELASEPRWFDVWPWDTKRQHRFLVAEGYPSLFWKQCLGARTRNLPTLQRFLEQNYPKAALPRTADEADAVLLALGGRRCLEEGSFATATLPEIAWREGWIAGLPCITAS